MAEVVAAVSSFVTPQDHGATGDGTTDDRDALLAAGRDSAARAEGASQLPRHPMFLQSAVPRHRPGCYALWINGATKVIASNWTYTADPTDNNVAAGLRCESGSGVGRMILVDKADAAASIASGQEGNFDFAGVNFV